MRKGLAAMAMMMLGALPAQQARADVVVELYTSQGCSSCPPADALLGQLAERDGVIALSLHVDYWDYLGWKDQFANPAFTLRQRRYAAQAGSSMIYTPQMVVGGKDHLVGTKGMELADLIAAHAALPERVSLQTERRGQAVMVRAESINATPGQMIVQLVQYAPNQSVAIKRGENAGKQITYHNVVMGWTKVADWDGKTPLSFDTTTQGDQPAIVIIQEGQAGPIVAAAKVD